jgi:hypothetical protein
MIDCPNVAVRESLPEFLHDALDGDTVRWVEAHLAECVPCTEELELLRAVIATMPARPANVTYDVAHIVAAIPPYRRRSRMSRVFDGAHMRMAAGFLIAAVGVSAMTFTYRGQDSKVSPSAPVATSAVAHTDAGLALVGVSNLTDDQLVQLTRELDQLDATPMEEPESVTPLAMEGEL